MEKLILLSAAYGWFAGLLIIMIVVTALFGLILFIALKPIKKDSLSDTSATNRLKRREAELTVELLRNKDDATKTDKLLKDLREVKSAEKLVSELMEEPVTDGDESKKEIKSLTKDSQQAEDKNSDTPEKQKTEKKKASGFSSAQPQSKQKKENKNS